MVSITSWCYQSALKPADRCRWWCFQVQHPKVFWILSSFKSRLWLVFFFVISKVHQDEWFKFLKFLRQFWNFVWLMRSEGLVRLLQWFDWVGNQSVFGSIFYLWKKMYFLFSVFFCSRFAFPPQGWLCRFHSSTSSTSSSSSRSVCDS